MSKEINKALTIICSNLEEQIKALKELRDNYVAEAKALQEGLYEAMEAGHEPTITKYRIDIRRSENELRSVRGEISGLRQALQTVNREITL